MADFLSGVTKVNGATLAGEVLTLTMDFWTVTTSVSILTAGSVGGSAVTQAALDKLVEVISLRGQPVILSAPTGTGPYVLKFAIEHVGSWDAVSLVTAIKAAGVNYGFAASTTSASVANSL